ncbi:MULTISPECIES: ABC transporter ATP-binding protein [unclassified Gilliamella]|uniref:ABC transporter ATP-binding protein n=1 Tax=unclassified Gilliamella TaxID=2685620 RepID=UPI0013223B13|nr:MULTISPECIES: ABC transporter ATP-binding protein [unclassified Gilliamella]MWN32293.1 dipeptide ABC transporter ATP-binding protein [Gilliamella sp. Pra-s60]MWP29549.1 dipeptide ABC transporter ATP-binding protein [Gilliamella sp. Pra-s54]
MKDKKLTVKNLTITLPSGADRTNAINDVSLDLYPNEILCIVGESGSGKSILSNAIMGLLPDEVIVSQGEINFNNNNLLTYSEDQMRKIRGAHIGMVFQDPMTALNPLKTIASQIGEMFTIHTNLSKKEIKRKVIELLTDVQISDPIAAAKAYPHQLSGGQRQRAMIAMALALEPTILIADEPTTALDVTTQACILKLIRQLQIRKGTSILFITHDFGVVAEIATRVIVMQQGKIVEQGSVKDVLNNPLHPYTQKLIAAVPPLVPGDVRRINKEIILQAKSVSKTYHNHSLFKHNRRITYAVNNVSFKLHKGSTLGIVGESGSGKSTLARCIIKLLDIDSGQIDFNQTNIANLKGKKLKQYTRHIQMVFQDPYASLNPRRKVGEQVAMGPWLYGASKLEARTKAEELFKLVGLGSEALNRYPHEFSGGQRQRIGIARALALEPKVLIADEPVSALDVSVQSQVLELLSQLQQKLGLTILFITHDLRVAAQICDHILVMKSGQIVEHGIASQVFLHPTHTYTKNLLNAVPGQGWNPPRLIDMSPAIHI